MRRAFAQFVSGRTRFAHKLLLVGLLLPMLSVEASAQVSTVTPHIEARGTDFEMLGIVKGNTISIYLDDAKTNEPVPKAKFSIDTSDNSKKLALKETEPGVYFGQADWLTAPGVTDFMISVKAGKRSDLLGASLKIAEPPPLLINVWAEWKGRATFLSGFLGGVFTLWLVRVLLRARPPAPRHARPAIRGNAGTTPAGATTAAAMTLAVLAWASIGSAQAMPAGPGHSHGPDDVSVDVAPDNLRR